MDYKPYTYLIGWTERNIWYYGVQYGKKNIANPDNLWRTYFTSSIPVKMYREEHGEPDHIEVRKVFSTEQQARLWESKVLKRIDAANNPRWLNNINSDYIPFHTTEDLLKLIDNVEPKQYTAKEEEDNNRILNKALGYVPN